MSELKRVAEKIAADLFRGGVNELAERLELKDKNERGLGGWAIGPAIDAIERVLQSEVRSALVPHPLVGVDEALTRIAGQLTAVLVIDLGYTTEPVHGHHPIRHQLAWRWAEESLGGKFAAEVNQCAKLAAADKAILERLNGE